MKKQILVLVVLVLIAIALMAVTKPLAKNVPASEGPVALTDLGVSVILPQGLSGLAVGTTTAPVIGAVVSIAVPIQGEGGGRACELGVFYNIPKSVVGTEGAWSEADLKAAAVVRGNVPPQVKEFETFYFVFEPAQAACATTPDEAKVELALREALWISVSTATLIPGANPAMVSIEDYVRAHIEELSPESAVLGGTFYVTAIEAHGGAGTVSYEDGHVALTADFTYSVSADGEPRVDSFVVRP